MLFCVKIRRNLIPPEADCCIEEAQISSELYLKQRFFIPLVLHLKKPEKTILNKRKKLIKTGVLT
jgi:hypothetical protein